MAKLTAALDKIPPQSLEAEQSTLGSMMISRSAVEQAMELLQPEDFYRDAHRFIFEAISDLSRRDEPADLLTVKEELERQGRLNAIGGPAYLGALIDSVPTAAHCEFYAKIVAEKAILRRLIDASGQIIAWAHEEEDDVDEIVDRAERLIFNVAQRHLSQYFVPLRPLLFEAMERLELARETHERITGVPTGFDVLDDMTAGLQASDFVIVAGRPSMGKCLTARTLLDHPLTGERLTIEEWVQRRIPVVLGLSERGEVRPAAVSDWVDSGVQPCYRVQTRTGRSVEVTGHHPFLTIHGWRPLHDLAVGVKIAVPRGVPAFGDDETWPLGLVRLLAYFIAEGGLTSTCPRFTNTDPVILEDFRQILADQFPECILRRYHIDYEVVRPNRGTGMAPNRVTAWLREHGLMGKRAEAKRFPQCVWQWSRGYLGEFLQTLFSCDGTVYSIGGYPRVEFAVASEGLAEDVHHALVRFGIVAKIWRKKDRCWRVEITEPESVARYQQEIGWIGEKALRCRRALPPRRSNIGHAPRDAWSLVRAAAVRKELPLIEVARRSGERVPARGYNPHASRGLPQYRLAAYAEVLDDPLLRSIAGRDIYWDEIVAIEAIGEHQVYDLTVPDGANFIAQDVCVHNTSLALAFGVNAAIRRSVPVALFSLEMSKEQLVQRMICSEAKVNAIRLRTGYLREAGDGRESDWRNLTRAIGKLGDLPIYVDDATDLTTREMRAKCRRLRAEAGLGLVVVDYLQLIRGSGRTENRTQEISEIARDLKSLAREMQVPVVALSQLSRAVERREDKRPMLSDLRECVVGDTRLIDATTGALVPIRSVKPGDRVLGLGDRQKIGAFEVRDVWTTGVKPVFTMTTRTGRAVTATANHPFLTARGWKRLEELQSGDIIATAMRLPEHGQEMEDRAELCRLLGYLIGDGTFQKHRAVGLCGSDPAVIDDAVEVVTRRFPGVSWREKKAYGTYREGDFRAIYDNGHGKPYGNPLREWLREINVVGQRDSSKIVPDYVFEAGDGGAREFLAGYLSTDGCVKYVRGRGWWVHFDTVSRQLAEDVQMLLLRLGVVATIDEGVYYPRSTRPSYRIVVLSMAGNLRRFADQVKPLGRKGALLDRMVAELPEGVTNGSFFGLPPEISDLMFESSKHLRQQGRKLEGGRRLYWKPQGKRPRRDTCARFAELLKDDILSVWAHSDLLWEEIRRIEPAGEADVYDISIPGCGNFLANGIVAHNSGSIEAEADLVMMLYRSSYYRSSQQDEGEQAAPIRAGAEDVEESGFLIAKHRNGPVGTVKLAFLRQYARFENLADYE